MANLTIQDLPSETLLALRTRAAVNHRSLNGEVLFIFHWVAEHGVEGLSMNGDMTDPHVAKQKLAMEDLIGSWDDDRSADEIISEVRGARTGGREVSF